MDEPEEFIHGIAVAVLVSILKHLAMWDTHPHVDSFGTQVPECEVNRTEEVEKFFLIVLTG